MAAPSPAVPNDRDVFRGLAYPSWVKKGKITRYAFLLRPAKPPHPLEEELSLGMTRTAAVDELDENFGVARLSVAGIVTLPFNLSVRFLAGSDQKAELLGLPLFSTEQDQRDLALTVAREL